MVDSVVIHEKMKFEYLGAPQRSPEWFKVRLGKVTASRLEDWLSVSKAKNSLGKPLKKRLDYEKEIRFEQQFGRNYNVFVSEAMQDGIDLEDFARRQYEKIEGVAVDECGCWYNDFFVASPDGTVGDDGLVEVKVLRDNSFTEVLTDGVPEKHWKQVQGQLWASGRAWCDYIAINITTRKLKIIRVLPDKEFHDWLEVAVADPITIPQFSTDNVYDFVDPLPEGTLNPGALLDRSDTNLTEGW